MLPQNTKLNIDAWLVLGGCLSDTPLVINRCCDALQKCKSTSGHGNHKMACNVLFKYKVEQFSTFGLFLASYSTGIGRIGKPE